jgi:hypothetical protein
MRGTNPSKTKTKNQKETYKMKTIQPNTTLTARSIGDYNCIYSLRVISRAAKTAMIEYDGKIRRAKIKTYGDSEYIRPENYSMAPSFYAI